MYLGCQNINQSAAAQKRKAECELDEFKTPIKIRPPSSIPYVTLAKETPAKSECDEESSYDSFNEWETGE